MNDKFNRKKKNSSPLKKHSKTTFKSPTCHWCHSPEIKLVPVSSLVNLKLGEKARYQKLWQRQGWPTNRYLCWVCKQNCELVHQRLNLWLCPGCRKCLVYPWERKAEVPTYEQLPTNCFKCGWQKKHLTKKEQVKITKQAIKSGLDYIKGHSYFAQCNFCPGKIEGQRKNKLVRNRNQLRFWTDKVSEERLICNGCLRENGEFQKLLLSKYRKRWLTYKSRGQI